MKDNNIVKQAKHDIYIVIKDILSVYNSKGASYTSLKKFYKKKVNLKNLIEDIKYKNVHLFDNENEYINIVKEVLFEILDDKIAYEKDKNNKNNKMKNLKTFENYDYDSDLDSDELMSDEEIKEDVLFMIKRLESNVNTWSTREILKHFTKYGFWSEGEMASLDIETAKKVAEELYNYVDEFPVGHTNIEEVYDDLYKYWG